MQKVHLTEYGDPRAVLSLVTTDIPAPKKSEVLVEVKATAVNDYDWCLTSGRPLIYRLIFGLFKPKKPFLGMELSGVVQELGERIQGLKVGDRVYSDLSDYRFGSFAEYITVPEKALTRFSETLSYEQAATIPHAGLLAFQGLLKAGSIKGKKVLINGAGGGVGAFAVALARYWGASEIIGVDTAEKSDWLKSRGFDRTIDYKKVDITKLRAEFDIVLDCKSQKTARHYLRPLRKGGAYISTGGKSWPLLTMFFTGRWLRLFSGKRVEILALKSNKDLEKLTSILMSIKFEYPVDGPYLLEDVPKQVYRFGHGLHHGKIIICP